VFLRKELPFGGRDDSFNLKGKERKSIYIALFWPRWYT